MLREDRAIILLAAGDKVSATNDLVSERKPPKPAFGSWRVG